MSGQAGPPAGAAAPAVASDQSMEDILASIRRILNEDDVPASPDAPAAPAEAEAPPEAVQPAPLPVGIPVAMPAVPPPAAPAGDEPLLLTEDMMVPAPAADPPPAALPPAPPPMALSADSLLAPAVAAAATASVGQLLRTVASERGSSVYRGGPSIEDVVREELRPLLKAWLDQHVPGIVERLVRAEIERVVGRALT